MRILYIGNHEQGPSNNDDEGSITHALTQLGHHVERLREKNGHNALRASPHDMVLFHKWDNVEMLRLLKENGSKLVFWYFDLVNWPNDPTLAGRNRTRMGWMERTIPEVDLGFCTDGDWVNQDQSEKLIRLTQGADNRVIGYGSPDNQTAPALLFSGTPNGGRQRQSFVDEMQVNYRQSFNCVRNVHGVALRDLIAASKICIAPDSPVTDNYWSNRVYITCGFAGLLLHPYCKTLAAQYQEGSEIVFYRNRSEIHELIKFYLSRPETCKLISQNALYKTMREHTYVHRCEQLMDGVQRRLF